MFALQLAQLDSSMSLREYACLDSLVLVSGIACMGLVFFLLVADAIRLELLPPLRSYSCQDPASLVLKFAHPGPTPSPRHFAWSGFNSFVHACCKSDPLISSRSSARSDSLASSLGTARAGLVFLRFVADKTYLGLSPPLRSCACLDSAVLTLGFAKLDTLMPLRSLGRSGASVSILSFPKLESFLPPRCSSKMGAPVLLSGLSKAGFVSLTLVLDLAKPDPVLLARSFAQLGLLLSTADSLCLGFLLSLRSTACVGFLLPVLAFAASGSFMFLQAMS